MNVITIKGRLTRDPELANVQVKDGFKQMCKFTVAVDRRFGKGADFFNCQVWGSRAEVINKYFRKGKEIVISGEMQCSTYKDEDGNNRYIWQITVQQFDFCGSQSNGNQNEMQVEAIPEGFQELDEDSLPF